MNLRGERGLCVPRAADAFQAKNKSPVLTGDIEDDSKRMHSEVANALEESDECEGNVDP